MSDLYGKKILLIGIGFYDYEQCIIDALNRRGAIVSYFSSDLPAFGKGPLHRVGFNGLATKLVNRKVDRLIRQQKRGNDYILIIKGYNLEKNHFDLLRLLNPDASIILYLWDSLNRLYNKKLLLSMPDKILTFDRKDSERYGLKLRPLFAREIGGRQSDAILYDVSFVGLDHSNRYRIIRKLKTQLDNCGLRYKFVLTISRKWKVIHRYITHRIKKEDDEFFHVGSLSYNEYFDILNRSDIILDVSHPKQSGLTMRTIETLAIGKRIMTTNSDIQFYNFSPDQYSVLNVDDPVVDVDFIKRRNPVTSNMANYTIDSFLTDLFS